MKAFDHVADFGPSDRVNVSPVADVSGPIEVRLPGSKSHATRLAVLAPNARLNVEGTADGAEREECGDVRAIRAGMRRLRDSAGGAVIDVADGGAPARFLMAQAARCDGAWTITGVPRLLARPMAPLVGALECLGARIEGGDGEPWIVHGTRALGAGVGTVSVDGTSSSQFASALLLLAPRLPDGLAVPMTEPLPAYVDITLSMLSEVGVRWRLEGAPGARVLRVERGASPRAEHVIPIDASAAAYFWVLGAISGARVTVPAPCAGQPDAAVLAALASMGGAVHGEVSAGGTRVEGPLTRGIDLDVGACPDSACALAVAAAFAPGRSRLRGAPRLRHKESDRVAGIVDLLAAAGVAARPLDDGVEIEGRGPAFRPPASATLPTRGDHRLVMAAALFGSRSPVSVESASACRKSFPGYFTELSRILGVKSAV